MVQKIDYKALSSYIKHNEKKRNAHILAEFMRVVCGENKARHAKQTKSWRIDLL